MCHYANPQGNRVFSEIYKDVDTHTGKSIKDALSCADYITFQYGLNEIITDDTKIGDRDSTSLSTLWGAWNTVLSSVLEWNPDVKIGIIISDAWMTQNGNATKTYTALKEIAEWWGIPVLDMKEDTNCPMMMSGRELTGVNPYAVARRDAAFKRTNETGEINAHPNQTAHNYRSTVIENFLRSL